jgi:hypothetical protein
MPTTLEGVKHFLDAGILYAPGKASNAGGVATSGIEMMQNSMRMSWTRNEVDARLRGIMKSIHKSCWDTAALVWHSGQLCERREHRRLHEGRRRDDGPGAGVIDLSGTNVTALELQVAARLSELAALKAQLQTLQDRYLGEIGPLYAELIPLDAAVAEAEIKAGLRVPDDDEEDADVHSSRFELSGCGPASEPSVDLKRMFRDVAKVVHPDLSPHQDLDERTRFRRHSLMAEANRAYAERDEDRLRLIMRAWALEADTVIDDPDAERARRQRRTAALQAELVELDREFADLRRSAIGRLQRKIDDARAQGWDLFGEMQRQTKREIATARAKLARLNARSPAPGIRS